MTTPRDFTDTVTDPHAPADPYADAVLVSTPTDKAATRTPRLDVAKAVERMDRRRDGHERPVPLPWATVNTAMNGGFWPGTMNVLVGGTGAGKTQWCVQVALHAAQQGTPVLYVALEADPVEFVARCLALLDADRSTYWSALAYGLRPAPADAHATLDALPLHVVYGEPLKFNRADLDAHAADMRAQYPDRPVLVVLDFLQLVGAPPDERLDLRERIGQVSYAAKHLARENGFVVLLASATARENYARLGGKKAKGTDDEPLGQGDPGRLVGLGKESGEIEYAADGVLVLGSTEPWTDPRPTQIPMKLAVAKIRAGRPAWVELTFDWRTFTDPNAPIRLTEAQQRKRR